MIFETNRLKIRELSEYDIDGFYDIRSDEDVMKHIKKKMNFNESKIELNRFIGYYNNFEIFYCIWAIESKSKSDFLGICGVYLNEKSEFEIAYRFRKIHWGKGYGKEVVNGLIEYCLQVLKFNELVAYIHSQNIASIRIIEKEMYFVHEYYNQQEKAFEKKYRIVK